MKHNLNGGESNAPSTTPGTTGGPWRKTDHDKLTQRKTVSTARSTTTPTTKDESHEAWKKWQASPDEETELLYIEAVMRANAARKK